MSGLNQEALSTYLHNLQRLASKCKDYLNFSHPKPLIEAFIQGLKPYQLRDRLMDEFKTNRLTDIEVVVARTLYLYAQIAVTELNNHLPNASYHKSITRSPSFYNSTAKFKYQINPSNAQPSSKAVSSSISCCFCKTEVLNCLRTPA
ncbi:hypothetical protein GEMRC1_000280 [Eukaryota sp. GEM-RC1]